MPRWLLRRCFAGGRLRFWELTACRVGHESDCARNFYIIELTTTLRCHGSFACQCGVHQCFKTLAQTWPPLGSITNLGCAGYACGMAGRTLGLVDGFATLQRAVGVANFNGAYFLNALGLRECLHASAFTRFGRGAYKLHQTNDEDHRQHKGECHCDQQLLGIFNGTGVA